MSSRLLQSAHSAFAARPASLGRRTILGSAGAALGAALLPSPFLARTARATPLPAAFGATARLFPGLRAALFAAEDLERLACGDGGGLAGMSSEPETLKDAAGRPLRDADGCLQFSATPESEIDDEENFGIPAGYTYLGQLVDHDLTHNPQAGDANGSFAAAPATYSLRTVALDLDSLYGRGPGDQPYLYEPDGRRLLLGRPLTLAGRPAPARDLPRLDGRAVVGDKREDENVIVSQLHAAFAQFHNALAADRPAESFEELRRTVARHYQWVLLTDFLPRLCGAELLQDLLPGFAEGGRVGRLRPRLTVARALEPGVLPLEFTIAAYRIGHSMVRPVYRLNTEMTGTAVEQRDNPGLAGRRMIFAASSTAGLNGFRPFPADWGIDWRLYFEVDRRLGTAESLADGPRRVQPAYKFDTALVNPLAFLPEFAVMAGADHARTADGNPLPRHGAVANLAMRNLLRGVQHGMPSGQAVARAMGLEPIADADLRVGKATAEDAPDNPPITAFGESFRGNAPLWFYLLAEAQHAWTVAVADLPEAERDGLPQRLGPVGGRLVAETLVAVLLGDPDSVLNAGAGWAPSYASDGRFAMPELLGTAGLV